MSLVREMLYGPAMRPSPLFLACLVVGCGGRADESGQPIPAASSTPPTADVSPSAPAGPARSGNISLTSAGGRLAVSAHFPLAGAPAAQTLGPECISRTDATGSALESVSAGEIVVNLPSGGRTLKLSYDATKRAYEDASLEGAVAAGSPVTIRVAGTADVPAFDVTGAAAETAQVVWPVKTLRLTQGPTHAMPSAAFTAGRMSAAGTTPRPVDAPKRQEMVVSPICKLTTSSGSSIGVHITSRSVESRARVAPSSGSAS